MSKIKIYIYGVVVGRDFVSVIFSKSLVEWVGKGVFVEVGKDIFFDFESGKVGYYSKN